MGSGRPAASLPSPPGCCRDISAFSMLVGVHELEPDSREAVCLPLVVLFTSALTSVHTDKYGPIVNKRPRTAPHGPSWSLNPPCDTEPHQHLSKMRPLDSGITFESKSHYHYYWYY